MIFTDVVLTIYSTHNFIIVCYLSVALSQNDIGVEIGVFLYWIKYYRLCNFLS